MRAFRFFGIPDAVAREVRESMRAPGYGHPAHKEQASGNGPCRLCLRTFRVGSDERIHAETCARYDAFELPPDFRALPMVLEGYGLGGRLGARYVHVRNAEVGCFMARVEGHAAP